MLGEWVESLKEAYGIPEFVIAVNIDIRGFTEFCQRVESVDVAAYIKKIYIKILEDYFPNSSYSKPMGDGLFIIFNYNEENLVKVVNNVIDNSIKLIDDFGALLNADHMITYDVPDRIGIGITRGSACCIKTDNLTIDYSGKTLNHAARLMDKARPSGLVCDHKEFDNVLKPELKELFIEDAVCLRGISEKEPIKILHLKDRVKISITDRIPIDEPIWHQQIATYKIGVFRKWRSPFSFALEKNPISPSSILLIVQQRAYESGEPVKGISRFQSYNIDSDPELTYIERAGVPAINLQLKELKDYLKEEGIPDDEDIEFTIRYNI